jgi:hypothetical protein
MASSETEPTVVTAVKAAVELVTSVSVRPLRA